MPPRVEQIAYDAGRHALAEQEAFVSGIRARAGTLLAAHALVASFLGATVLRERGLEVSGWIALATLVIGLAVAEAGHREVIGLVLLYVNKHTY